MLNNLLNLQENGKGQEEKNQESCSNLAKNPINWDQSLSLIWSHASDFYPDLENQGHICSYVYLKEYM